MFTSKLLPSRWKFESSWEYTLRKAASGSLKCSLKRANLGCNCEATYKYDVDTERVCAVLRFLMMSVLSIFYVSSALYVHSHSTFHVDFLLQTSNCIIAVHFFRWCEKCICHKDIRVWECQGNWIKFNLRSWRRVDINQNIVLNLHIREIIQIFIQFKIHAFGERTNIKSNTMKAISASWSRRNHQTVAMHFSIHFRFQLNSIYTSHSTRVC